MPRQPAEGPSSGLPLAPAPAPPKRLGLRKSRQQSFTREQLRREAIGVLGQIRHLTADQRRRVLEHRVSLFVQ